MRLLKELSVFGRNNETRAGTATPWLLPRPDVLFLLPSYKAQSRLKRDQQFIKKRPYSHASPLNRALTTAWGTTMTAASLKPYLSMTGRPPISRFLPPSSR